MREPRVLGRMPSRSQHLGGMDEFRGTSQAHTPDFPSPLPLHRESKDMAPFVMPTMPEPTVWNPMPQAEVEELAAKPFPTPPKGFGAKVTRTGDASFGGTVPLNLPPPLPSFMAKPIQQPLNVMPIPQIPVSEAIPTFGMNAADVNIGDPDSHPPLASSRTSPQPVTRFMPEPTVFAETHYPFPSSSLPPPTEAAKAEVGQSSQTHSHPYPQKFMPDYSSYPPNHHPYIGPYASPDPFGPFATYNSWAEEWYAKRNVEAYSRMFQQFERDLQLKGERYRGPVQAELEREAGEFGRLQGLAAAEAEIHRKMDLVQRKRVAFPPFPPPSLVSVPKTKKKSLPSTSSTSTSSDNATSSSSTRSQVQREDGFSDLEKLGRVAGKMQAEKERMYWDSVARAQMFPNAWARYHGAQGWEQGASVSAQATTMPPPFVPATNLPIPLQPLSMMNASEPANRATGYGRRGIAEPGQSGGAAAPMTRSSKGLSSDTRKFGFLARRGTSPLFTGSHVATPYGIPEFFWSWDMLLRSTEPSRVNWSSSSRPAYPRPS